LSFQNLILPSASLPALYGSVLVQTGDVSGEPAIKVEKPFVEPVEAAKPGIYGFAGKNRKNITLVVHAPGKGNINEKQLTFLTRILQACKLGIDDVAIVNHALLPVENAALKQQLAPKNMVLFGVSPIDIGLPLTFPLFKLHLYDTVTYLHVPAIDELNKDTEDGKLLKTKLWVCLRQMFQV
jgi:hypothetical protein